MERKVTQAKKAEANLAKLPDGCFAKHPVTGATVYVRKGASGYYAATPGLNPEELNAELGVTPAQANALLAGSLFGWHVPAADPDNWTRTPATLECDEDDWNDGEEE